MRLALLAVTAGAAAALAFTASAQNSGPAPQKPAPTATAALKTSDGKDAGAATFWTGPRGVVVRLTGQGWPAGWHAIHFHAKGDCSDAKFEAAGGHINHAESKIPHGLLNPEGPDFGDLPNVYAAADGSVNAEVFWSANSARADAKVDLLDADGSALVVHANEDDHVSQPIGGAGPRIACGVITAAGR
jgi:Cu-Zn family superoxide dismutase